VGDNQAPAARFVSAAHTNQGRRTYNEDAFLNLPDRRIWAVADGMGGHTAGDVASKMIVERLAKVSVDGTPADLADAIDQQLDQVNADLRQQALQRKVPLIGSTVALMVACPEYMLCGWAGDSRAYRFRDSSLARLSRDHSTMQEMMDTGMFTAESLQGGGGSNNAITRAVGGEQKLVLDWVIATYEPGTLFMLCSDGLTKEVPDPAIEAEFRKGQAPEKAAGDLVNAALTAGGRDNVTVLVVKAEA